MLASNIKCCNTCSAMHSVQLSAGLLLFQGSKGVSSSELYYSYERTRTSITAALCKKLKDQMSDFQHLRNRFADEHRYVMYRPGFTCLCCLCTLLLVAACQSRYRHISRSGKWLNRPIPDHTQQAGSTVLQEYGSAASADSNGQEADGAGG